MNTLINTINSINFYGEYHGHKISHLTILLNELKKQDPNRNFAYLAGDSSLDNKYWLLNDEEENAVNGYQHILKPPVMKPDIAYHMNKLFESNNSNYCAINTSVEESTIALRYNELLPQDKFIQQNITNNDILIVSLGGNDIALRPSLKTIWNMSLMMYMNSISTIKKGPDYAWGMNHFINLFKNDVEKYILKTIGDKRPKKIIINTIYYPDEKSTGGWAGETLGFLGYNSNPKKLQATIRAIFKYATSKIKIDGSEVIPFAMYKILNGKDSNDYVQRVEPSNIGGFKLAQAYVYCCL